MPSTGLGLEGKSPRPNSPFRAARIGLAFDGVDSEEPTPMPTPTPTPTPRDLAKPGAIMLPPRGGREVGARGAILLRKQPHSLSYGLSPAWCSP